VAFDDTLRAETGQLAQAAHALVAAGRTPPPEFGPKCRSCSFFALCRPEAIGQSASQHLARVMNPRD
jgi:CRISPR-associated exonuclease Cas4